MAPKEMEARLAGDSPPPWLFIRVNAQVCGQDTRKASTRAGGSIVMCRVAAYSPLKQFMGTNKVVRGGILGLGGVGHLGVLIAKAMGHHVTVISSSNKKMEEALE